jgi:predicted MFS family arabinose efflux permease
VLVTVVRGGTRPEPVRGGYRVVLRDHTFLHLAVINMVMIGVGWGVFTWVLPPYARGQLGVSPRLIGLLLLGNAAMVVVAQVPIARFAEGRRRAVMIAAAAAIFTGASLLVVAARYATGLAYAALVVADIAAGLGECFFTTALTPLVADLAPESLRGRYMASMGLSWWAGLAIAPTLGAQLLSVAPTAVFLVAAAASALAAGYVLALERRLPEGARLTPHPHGAPR